MMIDIPPELLPPTLTLRRRVVTHAVMLVITLAVAWAFNSPNGWFYP